MTLRPPAPPGEAVLRLEAIDATRGWAILLVMLVHAQGLFPGLPWPVVQVTSFGWYGVQLFFIASAFTLLRSWHRDASPLPRRLAKFAVRRLLRIGPAWWLAAGAYLWLRPPGERFDAGQFCTALAFLNGWSPAAMGTTADGWQVVPGGWSVAVECAFYVCFPLLALWLRGLRGALVLLLLATGCLLVAPTVGRQLHGAGTDPEGLANFLHFWFPNQLVVFALGFLLHALVASRRAAVRRAVAVLADHPGVCLGAVAAALLVLTRFGVSKGFQAEFPWLPTHVAVSLLFTLALLALLPAARPPRLLVNRWTRALGEVSFSAYLVHWAVLDFLHRHGGLIFDLGATGVAAIAAFAGAFPLVVLATFAISTLTFRLVEQPGIALAHRVLTGPGTLPGGSRPPRGAS